jgi:hypothetical protein
MLDDLYVLYSRLIVLSHSRDGPPNSSRWVIFSFLNFGWSCRLEAAADSFTSLNGMIFSGDPFHFLTGWSFCLSFPSLSCSWMILLSFHHWSVIIIPSLIFGWFLPPLNQGWSLWQSIKDHPSSLILGWFLSPHSQGWSLWQSIKDHPSVSYPRLIPLAPQSRMILMTVHQGSSFRLSSRLIPLAPQSRMILMTVHHVLSFRLSSRLISSRPTIKDDPFVCPSRIILSSLPTVLRHASHWFHL